MQCHKDCKPPQWTEKGMQLHPRTGQPQFGTGVTELVKGTGCIYTREGTGCCLLPTNGAVQPADLANPKIARKRDELLAAAIEAGDVKKPGTSNVAGNGVSADNPDDF